MNIKRNIVVITFYCIGTACYASTLIPEERGLKLGLLFAMMLCYGFSGCQFLFAKR